MKNASIADRILNFLANHPGRHKTAKIAEAIGASLPRTSTVLGELVQNSEIKKIKQGTYSENDDSASTPTKTRPDETLNHISEVLRSEDANKKTIDRLLNIYDSVLDNYETWVRDNVGSGTNFADQLLFIENFKWLTAIGDKLMKRWSLEHVGYDTNSRQAQEDAKAKTEAREQEVLKNAPLEDKIVVVGHYKEGFQEILEHLPKKEVEDISV